MSTVDATVAPATRRVEARDEIDIPLLGGESPVWDADKQALYFVDMHAPALFRLDPATRKLDRWDMPSTIGCCGLCRDGRLIVALRTGLHLFCPERGSLDFLVHPEKDASENRLNDGKVSPDGRFWVGSMNEGSPRAPRATLYRIDPDGSATAMLGNLLTSNGLAWSPDGRRMLHSDSRGRYIQAFDYDAATGSITRGRRLCSLSEAEGRPDGAAMDAAGYYWSAGVSAGCLNRVSPEGTIVERLLLPASAPTMPCFGGPDLMTIYVTSLAVEGHERGRLLSFRADVAGTPIARYG